MVTTIELRVDVSDEALPGAAEIAATVHLPDPSLLPSRPVVAFMFPGGGYSRHYFAMDLPDGEPGGEAAWHVARGWIVVAVDHLQVGESTVFDPDVLTFEHVVTANRTVVRHVLASLADGSLAPGFPAVARPFALGAGQSMGGCFTVVLQGQHHVFDAVAVLGYSAIHTVVPSRPGTPNVAMPWMLRNGYPFNPIMVNAAAFTAAMAPAVTDADSLAAAVDDQEHVWTWAFHHDDEPLELVQADMAGMTGGPLPVWRSATTPACAVLMVAPGAVAGEAAAITAPVLVAVGERDVVPDPKAEPKAYQSSPDVTVVAFPRMAHMHDFAPTRRQLWARLHAWADGLAQSANE